MDLLGTPLLGYIHGAGWLRPPGNPDFRLTKTAAQHVADGGPPANDYGDGNAADLDAVLAPHFGKVAQALIIGSANLSIDWTDASGRRWRAVLAHNRLPHPVKVGDVVYRGERVGTVGSTAATAQHLHLQYGYWSVWHWIWIDPWPTLEQNHNLQVNAGAVVNLREQPSLSGAIRGVTRLDGIRVDGVRVADHAATLLRRPTAAVIRDGYTWLPFSLVGVEVPLWIAQPFVHFL